MSVANPAVLRGASTSTGRHSPLATWILASRLARREVRRRKGRTVLVMLLVALPVFAMTVYSVLSRTTHDSHEEEYQRRYGASDLVVDAPGMLTDEVSVVGERESPDVAALSALLPAGSRVVAVHSIDYAPVRAVGAATTTPVRFTDLPLTDPMLFGVVHLDEGRVPSAPGEALLDPEVAHDLGVGVGDTLSLEVPAATYQVVGLGTPSDDFDQSLMVVGAFDFDALRADVVRQTWLADVPGEATPELLQTVSSLSGIVDAPSGSPMFTSEGDRQAVNLAWGWIGGVVSLAVMGIVITAAFATSARRQLVTMGQLSANGAGQSLMRRTLALQGAWSGLFGSVVGIGAAFAVLVLGRSWFEQHITGHDIGSYVFGLADLLVIVATGTIAATVAAFIPARSIARVPVLSALGGRRPLGKVPRRLVPTGLVLFAAGVFLLILVTTMSRSSTGGENGDLYAFTAVLGGLAVLFGMCCVTPAVVALLGPVGEALGGGGRLAARSLARSRTRTAAVVTAVAAAGSLAMAVGTGVASQNDTNRYEELVRHDTVIAYADSWVEVAGPDGGSVRLPATVPAGLQSQLEAAVPGSTIMPLRYAVKGEERYLVADDAVLASLGLTRADLKAIALSPEGFIRDNTMTFNGDLLIDEAQANELGYQISTAGLVFDAPHNLTKQERAALREIENQYTTGWNPFDTAAPTEAQYDYVWLSYFSPNGWTPPKALIEAIIVAVALLLTLIVVAIGTALAAAESRDERDVLVAVGAPPWSMRRVSALKAMLVSSLGGLLAIPTGFIPVAVVLARADDGPISFPWVTAAGLLIAVPLIIGAIAIIGAAIAQHVRPVHMSNLAFD